MNRSRPQFSDPCGERVLKSTMRIVARHKGWAYLRGGRAASCSSCVARSDCGVNALAAFVHLDEPHLRVPTSVSGEVGDEVVVSMPGADFVKLTFLAYLLPPIALAAVAAVSPLAGLGDGATAALCLPAFVLSLIPLLLIERSGQGAAAIGVNERLAAARQTGPNCEAPGNDAPKHSPKNIRDLK
jgi:sigma-E factor negative regulatory protein RseC